MAWLTTSAPPTPDIEQDTQIPAKPDADAEALRRITSGQLHRWRPSVVLAHFMRILLVVPGHYVVLQFINPIVPPIAGLSLVPSRRDMASTAGHNFSSQPEVPAPNDDDDDNGTFSTGDAYFSAGRRLLPLGPTGQGCRSDGAASRGPRLFASCETGPPLKTATASSDSDRLYEKELYL